MLVLTRTPQESIRVGEDISIVVIDIKGKQVRLGVNAPRNIAVDREEIYRAKHSRPAPANKPLARSGRAILSRSTNNRPGDGEPE